MQAEVELRKINTVLANNEAQADALRRLADVLTIIASIEAPSIGRFDKATWLMFGGHNGPTLYLPDDEVIELLRKEADRRRVALGIQTQLLVEGGTVAPPPDTPQGSPEQLARIRDAMTRGEPDSN